MALTYEINGKTESVLMKEKVCKVCNCKAPLNYTTRPCFHLRTVGAAECTPCRAKRLDRLQQEEVLRRGGTVGRASSLFTSTRKMWKLLLLQRSLVEDMELLR